MKQTLALLLFAIGAFSPNYFPVLPNEFLFASLASVILCLSIWRRILLVSSLVVGLTLGLFQARHFEDQMLPPALDAGLFQVSGLVRSAQSRAGGLQRIEIKVNAIWDAYGALLDPPPDRLLVSWYGDEHLRIGDQIVAEARLRRPRGLQNPGLFDYQQWLVAEGFAATGYLRNLRELHRTEDTLSGFSQWRQQRIAAIAENADLKFAGIHIALAFGDGQHIEPELWDLFRGTGTVHLMVISGLHVGLLAGIGYLLGFGLGRCLSAAFNVNAVRVSILFSLGIASLYCVLSGFGLPAQRAFVMISAFLVPRYFYLHVSRWFSFALALAAIAIIEPRAVLQTGFWLSFGAVFLLFLGFGSVRKSFMIGLLRTQLLFLTGFSGVLLWQGLPVPTASFLANLVAVPLVSLVVVPLEVLALVAALISDDLGTLLLSCCDWLTGMEIRYLQSLDNLSLPLILPPTGWGFVQFISMLCGLLFWAVPGWSLRLVLAIGCLPLLFPAQEPSYYLKVRIFDVGQGTAVLVEQPEYVLLYDTGPRFSAYFDSGADIIAPTLLQKRISRIDRLVVSHPDADHRGGLEGLLAEISVSRIDVGKRLQLSGSGAEIPSQLPCRKGEHWQHGEVTYSYLWPDHQRDEPETDYSDNDSSCVLLIEAGEISVLIPGDISASTEQKLAKRLVELRGLDVLIVPHHGSKSSSSAGFVRVTSPSIAVVSAGYLNRFKHPHPDVVERYLKQQSELINTAESGSIEILWDAPNASRKVTLAANSKQFWWQK